MVAMRLSLLLCLLALPAFAGKNLVLGELPPERKNGETLFYAIYVPRAYDKAKPAPLILALHGGRGTGEQLARFLAPLGEARGAIIACPQGFEEIIGADGFWWRNDAAEMAALDRFVAHVKKGYSIDPDQVSAFGLADGGELVASWAFSKDRGLKGVLLLNCLWLHENPLKEKALKVCLFACKEAQEKTAKLKDHAEKGAASLERQKVPVVLRLFPGASRSFFHGWEDEFRKAFDWFSGKYDWPRELEAEKLAPPPPTK